MVAVSDRLPAGLLLVDKPGGWTSHDVVAKVRRILGIRRVGHAGTLDPMATGLLVLGIGPGTRVLEYAGEGPKTYRAAIQLGTTTDTYDATGEVMSIGDHSAISADQVCQALERFRGRIVQCPPRFSAIKRAGVPLYRLARKGIDVAPEPREVTIHRIELLAFASGRADLEVECSAGTYIRSLAHDLGDALGCGAHLSALRRTRIGPFLVENALTPVDIEARHRSGTLSLLPLDTALTALPRLDLSENDAERVSHGIEIVALEPHTADRVRAYGPDSVFLAVLMRSPSGERWRAEKVFGGRSGGAIESEIAP